MSIFSSPQKRIEQAAAKVQARRAELAAAEAEHRDLRRADIIARLGRCKDDTLRPSGFRGAGWSGSFTGSPCYAASEIARQAATANDVDLARFEAWLDQHEANAR